MAACQYDTSRRRHILFFIKVSLIYNVVPISSVQQSDSVMHINASPFLSYLPSQSIPRDWIQLPVVYNRTLLLIRSKFNNLHLLTPNSWSVPLPLGNHTSDLYVCESVSLLLTGSFAQYFRFHICDIIWYLSFCF